MGGKVLNIIGRASLALLATALSPQMPVLAQSTNLAYQVANLGEDVRILQESIKSMRVQVESMRRENEQMRRQIGAYESRIDNSMGQLATVGTEPSHREGDRFFGTEGRENEKRDHSSGD